MLVDPVSLAYLCSWALLIWVPFSLLGAEHSPANIGARLHFRIQGVVSVSLLRDYYNLYEWHRCIAHFCKVTGEYKWWSIHLWIGCVRDRWKLNCCLGFGSNAVCYFKTFCSVTCKVKVKVNIDLYSASSWNLTSNALRCGSHSVNCQSHHTRQFGCHSNYWKWSLL